jgi:hypothetical protein
MNSTPPHPKTLEEIEKTGIPLGLVEMPKPVLALPTGSSNELIGMIG